MTSDDREEFDALWAVIRPQMPCIHKKELQAAQHAAWLLFRLIKTTNTKNPHAKTHTPPLRS